MKTTDRFKASMYLLHNLIDEGQRENPKAYEAIFGQKDIGQMFEGTFDGFDRLVQAEMVILATNLMLIDPNLINASKLRQLTEAWLNAMDDKEKK